MRSIKDKDFVMLDKYIEFKYQKELTNELDLIGNDFDQPIINEIVLWKVNRYAKINEDLLSELNRIKKTDVELNEVLTRKILKGLLETKGIQLPMASTILRFKN